MNKELFILNYRLAQIPIILSFVGFVILMITGDEGLMYALAAGLLCFTYAADQMMGKAVVGDQSVMMSLLPVSARSHVITKSGICGLWVGVITSIPVYLMVRNGGKYIDTKADGLEDVMTSSLFYRGLPQYRYALETNPSALDVVVGDLMDQGAGIMQIGLMTVLIPIILFLIGCYFGMAVLITQLYLQPVMKKVPTMVVSVAGMIIGGGAALGILFLIKGMMESGFINLFVGELLMAVYFGGLTWFLMRASVKRMENGFDVV